MQSNKNVVQYACNKLKAVRDDTSWEPAYRPRFCHQLPSLIIMEPPKASLLLSVINFRTTLSNFKLLIFETII